jgi:hypothetical protein
MTRPREFRAVRELTAGTGIDVVVTLRAADWDLPPVALRLGIVPEPDEEAMLAEAEAAAPGSLLKPLASGRFRPAPSLVVHSLCSFSPDGTGHSL